jgi:hypothetical protein
VAVAIVATAGCGGSDAPRRSAIFWTQSPRGGEDQRGTIGRAAATGQRVDSRFIVGATAPAGIAFDDRYVYWVNYATGTISRARFDGSAADGRFIKNDEYSVIGVAVDAQHVYWTNDGIDPNTGWIARANLDGTQIEEHLIRAGDSPTGVAVDGAHVYWTHRYWNRDVTNSRYAIGRANLDGSQANLRFIDVSNKIDGVAVNDRYVFWSSDGEHAIGRANIDGTGVVQRCITWKNVPLENVPEGVAVTGSYVYWTNYPANTIGRASLDGSAVDEWFIALHGVPEGIAVATRGATDNAGPCPATPPPVLFGPTDYHAGYYASGWGEVAPAVISNGGAAASGTIYDIHWRRWGGNVAVGRGLHPEYTPRGGYYRKPVVIELRAAAIRSCKRGGRLVYTRFTVREQVRPSGPMGKWFAWDANMCNGYYR